MTRLMRLALAAPGVLLAAATAIALVAALVDAHPMWRYVPLNLAEAAAARDEAEVVRQIQLGEDPNLRREIRAGLVADEAVQLTPLEAAVAANDGSVVNGLLTHGARPDATLWTRLRCLSRSDEVSGILEAHRPAGAGMECEGIEWPW